MALGEWRRVASSVERALSVSSMRRREATPWVAGKQVSLKSAVLAPPMWQHARWERGHIGDKS